MRDHHKDGQRTQLEPTNKKDTPCQKKKKNKKDTKQPLPCDLSVGEPWSPVANDGVADGSDPLLGAHVGHVQVMIAAAAYI
jgi:hypothetical protein